MVALLEAGYDGEGQDEALLDLGVRALHALPLADFHDYERMVLLRYVGSQFSRLGRASGLKWCFPLALSFFLAAHHIDPDEPGCLESLIYTYVNLDQLHRAKAAYDCFLRVSSRYALRDRVVQFYGEHIEPRLGNERHQGG
jgi:hypothetical protein